MTYHNFYSLSPRGTPKRHPVFTQPSHLSHLLLTDSGTEVSCYQVGSLSRFHPESCNHIACVLVLLSSCLSNLNANLHLGKWGVVPCSLRESIPRLFNGGTTTMTTRCAPACSQALPVKPQGVWARGIEAWVRSRDLWNWSFGGGGLQGPPA